MASTTRIPAIMLALLEKFATLTYPAMVGGGPVVVLDGISGPHAPDHYVSVGGNGKPAATADQVFMNLGGSARDEEVTINCEASSWVGGAPDPGDHSAASDAQRNARTNAYGIVGAIETALRIDKNLTVGITDTPSIYWCAVGDHSELEQTSEEDPDSEKGRWATVSFDITAKAKI